MLNEILTPDEIEFLHLAWNSIFAPCIVVILISWLLELAFKIARRASIIHDEVILDDEWEQMNIDAYFFCIHKMKTFTAWLENYPHSEKMYERVCERITAYEHDLEYHRSQISPFSNAPVKHSPLGPYNYFA